MKTRFDWQLDPEEDDPFALRDESRAGNARLRRLKLLALLLLLSAGVAAGLWLVQRQTSLEERARAEVVQAFELYGRAIATRDGELFDLTLSAEDHAWRLAQKALWRGELLGDRAWMGLTAVPGTPPVQHIFVSPDLTDAELAFVQSYDADRGLGSRRRTRLVQTMRFHLQDNRWLYAPFDELFWGPAQTQKSGPLLFTYPQRDADLVLRLAGDIRAAVQEVCDGADLVTAAGQIAGLCRGELQLAVDFSTGNTAVHDDISLQAAAQDEPGLQVLMPAPTLVGLPVDEQGYAWLARAYVGPLVEQMRADLRAQAILPQQQIRALCLRFPLPGQRLFAYDPALAIWEQELAPRAWRALTALPDDSALLLGDTTTYLLSQGRPAQEVALQRPARLVGSRPVNWTASPADPRLIFQETAVLGSSPGYGWLDLGTCVGASCRLSEVEGYPTVAPDAQWMLLQEGSRLVLADAAGAFVRALGQGFSPFWLDTYRFGFVRFGRTAAGTVTTQITLGEVARPDLDVLLEGDDLSEVTAGSQSGDLFIDYVVPNPGAMDQLLISATGIRGSAGDHFVFSLAMTADHAEAQPLLQSQRSGAPGGVANVMTPTGSPPFLVSGNGRWLVMTELIGHEKDTWTILLHDLQERETRQLADTVPAMPGNFPLLDWSADGQWLLVADRQALRLLAPALDFEMVVPHAFDTCTAAFWTN